MISKRSAPRWLGLYVLTSGLNLLATFTESDLLASLTKPLLMPVLLAYFLSALDGLQHPLAVWVTRALFFSWLGDVLLMGSGLVWFGLGLVGFLAAQICYIAGFRAYVQAGPLRAKPWLALPYLAAGLGLIALLAPELGVLLLPVVVYATALVLMAILATGISPLAAAGGVLFLISDGLIALTELSEVLGGAAAMLIMPTYVIAQLLLVQGVLQRLGRASWRSPAVAVG